jgi:hypothetical protein
MRPKPRLRGFVNFATGIPILVSAVTLLLEHLPDESGRLKPVKPDFGQRRCFFDDDKKTSALILFHLPMLVYLLSTAVMFMVAICRATPKQRDIVQGSIF